MIRDEKPEFPMTGEIYGIFKGSVDHDVFEEALRLVLEKEPLLQAKVVRHGRRFYWCPLDDPPLQLRWESLPDDGLDDRNRTLSLIPIDVHREPGYQFIIRENSKGFDLVFAAHHACADGIAMLHFLGNLFSVYDSLRQGHLPSPDDFPNPQQTLTRELLHRKSSSPIPLSRRIRKFFYFVTRWLVKRPTPLSLTPDYPIPVLYWHTYSVEETQNLKRRGLRYGVSPNTAILCDVFRRMDEYLRETRQKRRGSIRVLIPINLRNEFHLDLPSTNLVGYSFLDLPIGFHMTEQELARRIQDSIDASKKNQTATIFVKGIRLFRMIPGLMRLLTSRLFCHATSVVSNVGVFSKAFRQERYRESGTIETVDCRLESLVGGPPLRVHTDISIGIVTHLGRMTITVSSRIKEDPTWFPDLGPDPATLPENHSCPVRNPDQENAS